MIQKITSVILITVMILGIYVPSVSAEDETDSYHYIVIDRATGLILLEQNSHERIFPASTTKVLTAYTALMNAGITSVFTVSPVASGPMETGAVRLGLIEGEQMQFYDMLHALMLKSANDAAVAIAENISGSVDAFCTLMNETAKKAGALDTHFTNPNGLHDDDHYTTVYDLAVITLKAMDNYTFATVVAREEYSLPPTNKHDEFPTLKTTNPILGSNEGMDFLVTGVKTGYTSRAKFTLVSSARNYTGRDVICVVANIPSRNLSAEFSLEIIKRAFLEYGIQSVTVPGGLIDTELDYEVATAMNMEYLMPVDPKGWKIERDVEFFQEAYGNPGKGDIIGTANYSYDGLPIGDTYLLSAKDLSEAPDITSYVISSFPEDRTAAFRYWFIVPLSAFLIVLFLLFIIRIRYNVNKARSDEDAV